MTFVSHSLLGHSILRRFGAANAHGSSGGDTPRPLSLPPRAPLFVSGYGSLDYI